MKLHFYQCNVCGKVIAILSDTGVPTVCCDEDMEELIPNETDGASEKHVPVFSGTDDTFTVKVGSTPHPMTKDHSISWIGLSTSHGFQFKELQPGDSPEVPFALTPDDWEEAAFAFCNIHGLWSRERKRRCL